MNSLPILLHLVPYDKVFPENRNKTKKPHTYGNTTDARNMIHINLSRSEQGENLNFENILIFFFANSSDTQTAFNEKLEIIIVLTEFPREMSDCILENVASLQFKIRILAGALFMTSFFRNVWTKAPPFLRNK